MRAPHLGMQQPGFSRLLCRTNMPAQVLYDDLPGVGWAWFPSGHEDVNRFKV